MKQILLFAAVAVLLTSCSAIQGVSGRVVTEDGEFTLLPDGRVEIVVSHQPTK